MANTETLFPILNVPRVNGLGRMALESEPLDAGHDVEFRSLAVRSILNRSVSRRLHWMVWSINPYRGCEFACRYCYARYTHEFLAPAAREALRGTDLCEEAPAPSSRLGNTAKETALLPRPNDAKNKPQDVSLCVSGSTAEPTVSAGDVRTPGGSIEASLREGDREMALDLRDPEAFERRIFVKSHASWLLDQELRRMAKQGRLHEEIALGTATDPWQPIERRLKVTRGLLEVMANYQGLRLGIVTKSALIQRDIDLLQQIHQRSTLVVHITITTPDADLARRLEPRAPRPDLRLDTVRRLREAGIRTGILNSPLLPGITDSAESIDHMAALARSVDASFFAAMPLFLKPCSRPTYFEFVREHFPHLQALYAERFRDMDFAARPYRLRLEALVRASCARHCLRERRSDTLLTRDAGDEKKASHSVPLAEAQGRLFD